MDIIQQVEKAGYRLTVWQDPDSPCPREWAHLSTTVGAHLRYDRLTDEKAENTEDYSCWKDWAEHELPPDVIAFPLYLTDHSSLTLRVRKEPDLGGWDSGQLGYIYCSKEDAEAEELSEDEVFDRFSQEMDTFTRWLNGVVYGYTVDRVKVRGECGTKSYEGVESVGGYYSIAEAAEDTNFPELFEGLDML